MQIKYELDRVKDHWIVFASIVATIIVIIVVLSEDLSEEPCLKGSIVLTIL